MDFVSVRSRTNRSQPSMAWLRRARSSFHQKLILLVTLVTFVLQGYIVQTHIHFAPAADVGAIVVGGSYLDGNTGSTGAGQHIPKAPIDDPAHCPICQEFVHAGQYLTPSPILTLLLTVVVAPITIVRVIPVVAIPVSHSWRGRAPPSA